MVVFQLFSQLKVKLMSLPLTVILLMVTLLPCTAIEQAIAMRAKKLFHYTKDLLFCNWLAAASYLV